MPRGHRALHGMELALVRKVLHRDQLTTVQLAKRGDTGVDRFIDQAAIAFPCNDDGARAAIALTAAFLGSRRALLKPQPIQYRRLRQKPIKPDDLVLPAKLDAVSRHLASELEHNGNMGMRSLQIIQGFVNRTPRGRQSRPS